MTARTSKTHPLQIAEVSIGQQKDVIPGKDLFPGAIGITFCPGKKDMHAKTGAWNRDLATDVKAIADWGAAAVLSLMEPHEFKLLGVAGLGKEVERQWMKWYHLPITDVSVADAGFEQAWVKVGKELRELLRSGCKVLIHCRGGLGRSGMIAARLLVELGWDAEEAIAAVRKVRPGAIETQAQAAHIYGGKAISEGDYNGSTRERKRRALGCLLGLAVGDAVGTALEFKKRDSYPRLTDMIGGGPFNLKPGQWTDDTAMALALGHSLIEKKDLDPHDLMQRFVKWWQEGEYSCTGTCFDIGITTSNALSQFLKTGDPFAGSTDPKTAGNGSIMRLAPVAIYFRTDYHTLVDAACAQGMTTHGAPEARDACLCLGYLLAQALNGHPKEAVLRYGPYGESPAIEAIAKGSWRTKRRDQIKSSGYVVHSLEAALWCVWRATNFREAILMAANLGDDADTVAAITGQIAGAIWGVQGIPKEWLDKLAWREEITQLGLKLFKDDYLGGLGRTQTRAPEETSSPSAPA